MVGLTSNGIGDWEERFEALLPKLAAEPGRPLRIRTGGRKICGELPAGRRVTFILDLWQTVECAGVARRAL